MEGVGCSLFLPISESQCSVRCEKVMFLSRGLVVSRHLGLAGKYFDIGRHCPRGPNLHS